MAQRGQRSDLTSHTMEGGLGRHRGARAHEHTWPEMTTSAGCMGAGAGRVRVMECGDNNEEVEIGEEEKREIEGHYGYLSIFVYHEGLIC